MNEQDKIKQLEDVVASLQQEVNDQKKQLSELSYKLSLLTQQKGLIFLQKKPRHQDHVEWSSENFIGLRLINLVGIVVLVIGLSIGVKYAIDRNLISEVARIVLAYAAGAALYILSWRLKKNYYVFSAILFSGAMASLYFTTYGAFVYYNMLSFVVAFLVMLLLTGFTTYKAIEYNRQEIAILGLVGAYAIPFLISRNEERADLFFFYIFIINCAIAFLSYYKRWLTVARVAQLITWILFVGWASMRSQDAYRTTGIIFLFLFFVLFTLIVFINRFHSEEQLQTRHVYQQLMNNIALYLAGVFIFAFNFLSDDLATVTAGMALLTALQVWLFHILLPYEKYLHTVHLVLAIVLSIIYVVFEWEGFIVTVIWMLMAIALFIAGFRIRSVPLRLSSIGLMGLTLAKLLLFDSARFSTIEKIVAYIALGILLLVVSFFYQKFREKIFEE